MRWTVASAAGLAFVTPAGFWGHGFVTSASTGAGPLEARGRRSVAVRGNVKGNITTGDKGLPTGDKGLPTSHPETHAQTQPPVSPGSVTASGERAIALGEGLEGDADTGDQPGGGTSP